MKKKVLTILTISIFVLAFHAYGDGNLIVDGITKVGDKIQAKDSGGIELATDEGTTRLFINDAGNIGFGTTSPYWTLHVKQSSAAGSSNIAGCFEDTTAGKICFAVGSSLIPGPSMLGAVLGYDADNSHGFLGFPTCPVTQSLVFKSTGNVGIGTTNPAGKLDVNGTIYQRGSQLHADYVFEEEYALESIEEHAEFMWKEKHLSAIPKVTVDENGQEIVELGARNKGVVEELEKAHIYIEELNELVKEQNTRLQALETKLEGLE